MSTKANAFDSPVIAALEVCAKRRWRAAENSATAIEPDDLRRTRIIIDAAAAKIEGRDYSGIESALAAGAHARRDFRSVCTAVDRWPTPVSLAHADGV